jgi:hypothetical protein
MVPEREDSGVIDEFKMWMIERGEFSARARLIEHLVESSCYNVDFSLERAGKVDLVNLAGTDTAEDVDLNLLLANQAFFFLKDIAHTHQHHHPTHDAITEVTEVNGSDDYSWSMEAQHSLYRAIIRFKRFRNEKALFRASGILAYAGSLQKSYLTEQPLAKSFHADQLEKSLSAAADEVQHRQQKIISMSETGRGVFFSTLGLVAASGIFLRLKRPMLDAEIAVDPAIVYVAGFAASEPLTVLGFVAIFSAFWTFFTHRKDPADF